MRLLIALALLSGCGASGVPSPSDGGACGALDGPCCVAPGPPDDLAGAAYAFACGEGLWCEHAADGVTGVCRRSP